MELNFVYLSLTFKDKDCNSKELKLSGTFTLEEIIKFCVDAKTVVSESKI